MGPRAIAILGLVCVETAMVLYLSLAFWITVAVTTLDSAGVFFTGLALVACTGTLIGAVALLVVSRKVPVLAGPMQAVLVASALLLGLCLSDSLRSVLSADLSVGGVGLFSAVVIYAALGSLRQITASAPA